jgi:hypothetical protein
MTTPNDAEKAAYCLLCDDTHENSSCKTSTGATIRKLMGERDALKAELERVKKDRDGFHNGQLQCQELLSLALDDKMSLYRENKLMRAVVEAAKEMRDLLHLRLRYCPEALWLEENYIKLKDALAALERGGDK